MLREKLSDHRGVWKVLRQNGYEAYFVGGCIRDGLTGRSCHDIDIATNAGTDAIKILFPDHIETGLKFGSIRVNHDGNFYDITTYRTEGEYSDSRHPDKAEPTEMLENDLERRDFTVNAMAFSFEAGLVDLFKGIGDIRNKIIRAVGDPGNRFTEDALRMMRAVRFSCELGFAIEENTQAAIKENCSRIKYISKERIYSEFERAVKGSHAENLEYLRSTGLGRNIHPGFRRLRFSKIPFQKDYILRLAYILRKPEKVIELLEFMRAPKKTIVNTVKVIRGMQEASETEYDIRKLMSVHGIANAKRSLILNGNDLKTYNAVLEAGDCLTLSKLQLNGHDLIENEIAEEGRDLNRILRGLLDDVLHDPENNFRLHLLAKAREIAQKIK